MKVGKKKIPINWDKIAGMAIAGAKSTVIANVLGYSYRTLQDRAVTDHGMTLVAFMEKEREEIKAHLVSLAIEQARVDPKMMAFVLGTVFGMKDTEWKKEQDSERNRLNREGMKIKQEELSIKKEMLELAKNPNSANQTLIADLLKD